MRSRSALVSSSDLLDPVDDDRHSPSSRTVTPAVTARLAWLMSSLPTKAWSAPGWAVTGGQLDELDRPGFIGRHAVVKVPEGEGQARVECFGDGGCRAVTGASLAGGSALQDSGVSVAQGRSFDVPKICGAVGEGRDGGFTGCGQLGICERAAGKDEGAADSRGAIAPGVASSGAAVSLSSSSPVM